MVYTMVYMMVYTLLCIMVYILVYTTLRLMVYTMIYIMVYTMIWLIHTTLRYRDCTGQHARTYCSQPHATATASYRRALHNGVACVLMNISQAGLQTGAVASCMRRSLRMQRPVRCGGQCDETWVSAIHKRRSIPHAKYGFIDVKHLHISQQCLVEQLHCDRCNFVRRDNYEMRAGRWRETWSCINGTILWATWNAAPRWSWRVAPRSSALLPSPRAKLRILWQQVRTVRQ